MGLQEFRLGSILLHRSFGVLDMLRRVVGMEFYVYMLFSL
jgi:hypothetical protein